jgi:hypothetical protein
VPECYVYSSRWATCGHAQVGPSKWGTLMSHEQTQLGSPGANDNGAHVKLTTGPTNRPADLVSWGLFLRLCLVLISHVNHYLNQRSCSRLLLYRVFLNFVDGTNRTDGVFLLLKLQVYYRHSSLSHRQRIIRGPISAS